ncbi:MAG TPA: site-2 protease family protein, partial [Candidatus Saccharimonadales bacterium]|nr:site-2 protease family protein [Candidatus Saccharimonadales bacterium]
MKILGIPTKIEPSFLVVSLFLAASRGFKLLFLLEWLVVVFISVLIHELGHALVARRFGLSPQITLYSMGGLTSWSEETEIAPPKHLAISLAGPAAGFLLGGVLFVAAPTLLRAMPSELLTVAYYDLLWVNIGWGVFNLFPILPLDGGHVLLTLERWITKKQDQIISYVISLLVSLTIIYLAFTFRSMWVAILGIWFAYSNASFLLHRLKASRDKKLVAQLEEAHQAITDGKFEVALDIVPKIQNKALTQSMRSEASRLLIFTFIRQKRYKEAEEELTKFYGLFGPEHYLQGLLSFEKNEMSQAIPDLKKAFAQTPDYQLGLLLSQALMAEKRYADVLDLCGHDVMSEAILPLSIDVQRDTFKNQEFQISGRAGALAYEHKPDPNIAYNAACAFARASDSTQALVWLERALAAGFNDKNRLATDSDLES